MTPSCGRPLLTYTGLCRNCTSLYSKWHCQPLDVQQERPLKQSAAQLWCHQRNTHQRCCKEGELTRKCCSECALFAS